jgi:hypothetical protein
VDQRELSTARQAHDSPCIKLPGCQSLCWGPMIRIKTCENQSLELSDACCSAHQHISDGELLWHYCLKLFYIQVSRVKRSEYCYDVLLPFLVTTVTICVRDETRILILVSWFGIMKWIVMNLRSIFDTIYEHTSVIGHVVWLDVYFSTLAQESLIPSRWHFVSESHRWNSLLCPC